MTVLQDLESLFRGINGKLYKKISLFALNIQFYLP